MVIRNQQPMRLLSLGELSLCQHWQTFNNLLFTVLADYQHLHLDGGGIRGLSSILILKEIMRRVNFGVEPEQHLQPWQVFDLIGGTSTGGYVPLLENKFISKVNWGFVLLESLLSCLAYSV